MRVVRVRKSRDAIWLNTFPKDRASDSAAAPCKPLRDLCSNSAAVAVAVGRCDKSHVEVDAQDREELAASIRVRGRVEFRVIFLRRQSRRDTILKYIDRFELETIQIVFLAEGRKN